MSKLLFIIITCGIFLFPTGLLGQLIVDEGIPILAFEVYHKHKFTVFNNSYATLELFVATDENGGGYESTLYADEPLSFILTPQMEKIDRLQLSYPRNNFVEDSLNMLFSIKPKLPYAGAWEDIVELSNGLESPEKIQEVVSNQGLDKELIDQISQLYAIIILYKSYIGTKEDLYYKYFQPMSYIAELREDKNFGLPISPRLELHASSRLGSFYNDFWSREESPKYSYQLMLSGIILGDYQKLNGFAGNKDVYLGLNGFIQWKTLSYGLVPVEGHSFSVDSTFVIDPSEAHVPIEPSSTQPYILFNNLSAGVFARAYVPSIDFSADLGVGYNLTDTPELRLNTNTNLFVSKTYDVFENRSATENLYLWTRFTYHLRASTGRSVMFSVLIDYIPTLKFDPVTPVIFSSYEGNSPQPVMLNPSNSFSSNLNVSLSVGFSVFKMPEI